jgi:hypothetical protein
MKKMKKGSLWVLFVVVVFGILMFFSGCQKQEPATEQPAMTEEAAPAPDAAAPAEATTGGAEAPATTAQ